MKPVVRWFTENHVAANLLMAFFLVGGIVTAFNIKVEVFPETSMDTISIKVTYPGAAPAEVEEGIIRRIEENVAGLSGIKSIDSVAVEGQATINLEVIKGWDISKLTDEVKSEVDRITTFPDSAEKPIVAEVTQKMQVISVAVYGEVPEATLKNLMEQVQDDVTSLPGITLATPIGVREGEVIAEISEKTLRRYGLTMAQVSQAIAQASLDLPGGRIKTASGEILIRTKGRRYWADDFRDISVLTRPDGSRVTLDQIAILKDGFEDTDFMTRFNGKPSLFLHVYRVADQNALDVAAKVKKYVAGIRPRLPEGVGIDTYQDMSAILKSRISLLLRNMAWGLVLVVLVLSLFLNMRLAFWVTLGIPISFAMGLMFLPAFDVSINMMSLFAFIMVLGIVVDDAIIVGENVYAKREAGKSRLLSSVEGTTEVGMPVVFSVLTTMAAFYPLFLAGGMMGKIIRSLPVVVILVLAGSLIEAFFVLPSHLAGASAYSRLKQGKVKKPNPVARMLKWFVSGPYSRFIRLALRWRYITMGFAILILLLTYGCWAGGIIKFTFFPKVEGDVIQALVTMPTGTSKERTLAVVDYMEESIKKILAAEDKKSPPGAKPLLEYTGGIVGLQFGNRGISGTGAHLGHVWAQLIAGEERGPEHTLVKMVNKWREAAGKVPDAESITFVQAIHSAGNAIEVDLILDDHEQLVAAAEEFKAELARFPGVFDIADSFLPGKLEMQFSLKPAARSLGLTLQEVARQVRFAFYGAEALRMQRDRDEVKVRVRYPEAERTSLGAVEEMRIRLPSGERVPFTQVAEVAYKRGYTSIERSQRRRIITVTADVDEAMANANEIRKELVSRYLPALMQRYPGMKFSVGGEGKEQMESLNDVFRGFYIALFVIYAMLAIPFKSFTQPLIVMLAIPFGFAGAVAGHLIMGMDISALSLFGGVGLAGVVVNDSLVLVVAANRLKNTGLSAEEAVARAGGLRFRAILLTSLTTFAGLTPMLFEKSLQARFLIPMAISLGYGVLFATFVTLMLIPCIYTILDDGHRIFFSFMDFITGRSAAVTGSVDSFQK